GKPEKDRIQESCCTPEAKDSQVALDLIMFLEAYNAAFINGSHVFILPLSSYAQHSDGFCESLPRLCLVKMAVRKSCPSEADELFEKNQNMYRKLFGVDWNWKDMSDDDLRKIYT